MVADVLLLDGPLGAGKTELVRGMATGLSVPGGVRSPTFNLVHQYEGGRLPLYHVDLYRVESVEELPNLGLDEFVGGAGVTVVEWAERLGIYTPPRALRLSISTIDGAPGQRSLRFTCLGDRAQAWAAVAEESP